MALYCVVCGASLPIEKKNYICSGKCRKKRSRDKQEASKRAYSMGFTIDNWSKLLSQGVITADEADNLLRVVWDRLGNFYSQVEAAKSKEAQTT